MKVVLVFIFQNHRRNSAAPIPHPKPGRREPGYSVRQRRAALALFLFLALGLYACAPAVSPPSAAPAAFASIPTPTPEPGLAPFSGFGAQDPVPGSGAAFAMDDLTVGVVRYGATLEQMIAALGQPSESRTYLETPWNETVTELTYPGGDVFFLRSDLPDSAPALFRAVIRSSAAGPRGLGVGSQRGEVVDAFKQASADDFLLYAAKTIPLGSTAAISVPPRGVIAAEPDAQGRVEIRYDVPVSPYRPDMADQDFIYEPHGTLSFFIRSDIVVEYEWRVRPIAIKGS